MALFYITLYKYFLCKKIMPAYNFNTSFHNFNFIYSTFNIYLYYVYIMRDQKFRCYPKLQKIYISNSPPPRCDALVHPLTSNNYKLWPYILTIHTFNLRYERIHYWKTTVYKVSSEGNWSPIKLKMTSV